MAFFKFFLLVLMLITIALAGLAIGIILKRNGKFPNLHISSNKHMRDRGITCAQSFDKMEQAKARKELSFRELNIVKDSESIC